MVPKRIDPSKLKAKYVLGNWASLPSYPDTEDLLYESIRDYCALTAEEIKFTDVSLAKRYSIPRERAGEMMEHLIQQGLAEITHSNKSRISYKIIQNPYA
jgi:hypothetical protein